MKAFDPSGWVNGVTIPHVIDFQNIATDLYTRGANVDGGGYGRPNTAFVTLVPGALPGSTYTVTGASWAGGVATLTIGGLTVGVNQLISVSGATPAGYNVSMAKVIAVAGSTISFALVSDPGAWISGGTVVVGTMPGFGTIAMDSNLNVKVYNGTSWVAATTAIAAGAWYKGSGAPGAGLGSNGDMYLDVANGDVYGPKTAGAWGSPSINIMGPTGPQGEQGAQGETGLAATIAVGTVTTGAPGSNATVVNSGTPSAASFDFTIPRGDVGATGPQGIGYNPRGAYAGGSTYAQGDMVTYSNVIYHSLQSNNTGHQPDTSPTWWMAAATGGGSQTPWISDIDAATFKLLNAGNVGIGTSTVPITVATAGRVYLTIKGATDAGVIELATGAPDADGSPVGIFGFTDPLNTQTEKRLGNINVLRSGTTANNRGGALTFATRADGATGITERMRIDRDGNVGIGTTMVPISTATAGSTYLTVKGSTEAGRIELATSLADSDGSLIGSLGYTDPLNNQTDKRLAYINAWRSGSTANNRGGYVTFHTRADNAANCVERMRIDRDGNVGIGVSALPVGHTLAGRTYLSIKGASEAAVLELVSGYADGDATPVGQLAFADPLNNQADKRLAMIYGVRSGITGNNRGGMLLFHTRSDGATGFAERMRITADGDVGIGGIPNHANLWTNLTILGTGDNTKGGEVRVGCAGSTYLAQFYSNSVAAVLGTISSTPLVFRTNVAERMRITEDGKVGIGTAGPGTALHVLAVADNNNGQLKVQGTTHNVGLSLYTASDANPNARNWQIQANYNAYGAFEILRSATMGGTPTTSALLITATGNVGIGTTDPQALLEVSGATQPNIGWYSTGGNANQKRGMLLYDGGQNITGGGWVFQRRTDAGGYSANLVTIIQSTGNVGIGTASPSNYGAGYTTLTVQGPSTGGCVQAVGDSGTNYCEIIADGGSGKVGTRSQHDLFIKAYNDNKMYITTGSYVGWRIPAAANDATCWVNGTMYVWYDESNSRLAFRAKSSAGSLATYYVGAGGSGITTQSVVTGSRAGGTVYQNTTGRPMMVTIGVQLGGGVTGTAYCDSSSNPTTVVVTMTAGGNVCATALTFWVLPNYYYKLGFSAAGTVQSWTEWY